MNENNTQKRPLGTRWCSTGFVMSITGIVLLILGIASAQLGLLSGVTAFLVFGLGLLAFVIAAVAALVGLLLSKGTGGAVPASRAWGALVIAVIAILGLGSQRPAPAPPIHDITTDIDDPPAFDAVAPLRADAPNPVEYLRDESAAQQQAAFPDLDTLVVNAPANRVFTAAENVVRDMGWELVAANQSTGIIEATDTTRWFRFKDDVVIRIAAGENGTAIDVRSKSRVGRGDMGANAQRIRAFLSRLEQAVASG